MLFRSPALRPLYAAALEEILASPVDRLVVGEMEGRVIATGQVTFVRSLPHRGRKRAIVEAVQVDGSLRNRGVGARLIAHLVELSRSEGAGIVELTSNAARIDAHRFYDRLGFAHSHVAFKLKLEP